MKITEILDEMKQVIETNDIRSPGWWLDGAMKLAVLRQNLQDDITRLEVSYNYLVGTLIKEGTPANQAERLIKGDQAENSAFKLLSHYRNIDRTVTEVVRIAKQKGRINEFN